MMKALRDFVRKTLLKVASNERRIQGLRRLGVRIGDRCFVATTSFSTEPYLVEIGDHVAISEGCDFVTHDAAIWVFRDADPAMDVFGRIKVGSNTYFGTNCTVLPNTTIGANCIIGSGSVVRGKIPDDSVVMGNPARVIMKTSMMKYILIHHRNRLNTHSLAPHDKEEAIRRHFGLDGAGAGR